MDLTAATTALLKFPVMPLSAPVAALTTTFVPAPSCIADVYQQYINTNPPLAGLFYLSLGPPNAVATSASCYPPFFTPLPATQFYSPGICPSGYSIACSSLLSLDTRIETHATCCPSHYTCEAATGFPAWQMSIHSTAPCGRHTDLTSTMQVTLVQGLSTNIFPTVFPASSGAINIYGISIRFQASDLQTPTPTSSPTARSGNSHGLSTGAKAGIGVGVSLAALIVIGLLGWVLVKRRNSGNELEANEVVVAELAGTTKDHELPGSEGKRLSEMPG